MAIERLVRRYSAYYRGWCQAFGEHETHDRGAEDDVDYRWLFGEDSIGLILPAKTRKRLLRELVGRKTGPPSVVFSGDGAAIEVNGKTFAIHRMRNALGIESLVALLSRNSEIHLFLTNHFFYPPGTRILTFSAKKPLIIMYKEMLPMKMKVLSAAEPA